MYYTIDETRAALKSGETTSAALVQSSIDTFNKDKSAPIPLNAFIEMYEDAIEKAARPSLNKKYGKANVDAIANAKLLVGMPLKLLVDKDMVYIRQGITVYKMYVFNDGESGQYKVQMYVYTGYNNPDGTPNVGTLTYRVWVKNWKITQFRNWTNNDEREFNRL